MNTKALPQAPFYSPAHLATYPRIGVPPNSESLLQARVLYHHNSSAVPPRESPFFSPNNMSAPASTEHFLPFRSPWNIDPLSSYPYASGFGNLDVRRKNATRESTSTLKAWLYEHIKNPYPTKGEKIMLAIITKMTLTQVSTWFANARRRLKKENKMQWSPRNRTGEDDDEDDDDDDGAERKCESADGFDACKMDEKDENEDEENIVVDAGTEDLPAPDVVPVSSAAKVNNERKLYLEMKNNMQSSTKENIRDDKEIWNNHNSTSKVSDNPKNISKSIFKSEKSSPTDSTKISEYFPAPSFPFHLHQHFPIHPLHYSHFIHAKHKQNCADKILFTDTHKDQNSDFLLPSNYPFKSNHLTPNSLRNNFRENNKSIKCKEFFYGAFNRAMDQRKRSPSKLLRHNEDSNDSTTAKVKTEIMNNDEDQNICMDHNDYDNQNELDQKNSDTSENDFDKKLHFSSYRSSPHICNDTSSMKRKNDEKTPEMNKKTKIWSLVDVATKDKKSGKENNCKKNLRLSFIKNAIEANDQMTHEKSVHDSKESHENSTERKHSENKSNGLCAKNLETGEREKEEIMRLWNQQSLHHRTYTLPNNKAFQPWNHYQNYHFLVHQRHHKQHYHQQLYHKNNRPLLLIPQRHHTSTTDEFLQKFSKSSQSSPKNTPDLSKHIPIEKPEEKSTSFEFCLKKTDSSSPTSLTNHSQHLSNSDSSNIHSFKAKQPSTLHVLPSSSSTSSTASLLSASSHKASQSKSTTSHLNKTYPKIDPIKVKATSSPKTPTSASDAKPLHTKHHPQNGHKMVVSCRKQSSDSTFEYWADNGDSQTVFKSKTSRQL